MSDLYPMARCTVSPARDHEPVMVYELYCESSESWVQIERLDPVRDGGGGLTEATVLAQVDVSAEEIAEQLAYLQGVRVPILLEAQTVRDGGRCGVELRGNHADVSLKWRGTLPNGCEGLAKFLQWLIGKAPDLTGRLSGG